MSTRVSSRVRTREGEEIREEQFDTHAEAVAYAAKWIYKAPGDLVAFDIEDGVYYFAVKTSNRSNRRRSVITVSTN